MKKRANKLVLLLLSLLMGCEFFNSEGLYCGARFVGEYVPSSEFRSSLYMMNEPDLVSGPTNYVLVVRPNFHEEWVVRFTRYDGQIVERKLSFSGKGNRCRRLYEVDKESGELAGDGTDVIKFIDMNQLENINPEICAVVFSCGGWARDISVPRVDLLPMPLMKTVSLVTESNDWRKCIELPVEYRHGRMKFGGVWLDECFTQYVSANSCRHVLPGIPANVTSLVLRDCFSSFLKDAYPNVRAVNWYLDMANDRRTVEDGLLSESDLVKKELLFLRRFANLEYLTLEFDRTNVATVDLSQLLLMPKLANVEIIGEGIRVVGSRSLLGKMSNLKQVLINGNPLNLNVGQECVRENISNGGETIEPIKASYEEEKKCCQLLGLNQNRIDTMPSDAVCCQRYVEMKAENDDA